MTNLTKPEQFEQAFAPMKVEQVVDGVYRVTEHGVALLVYDYYCAHCRGDGTDGEAWCRHKEAAFCGDHDNDAQDLHDTYAAALGVGVQ